MDAATLEPLSYALVRADNASFVYTNDEGQFTADPIRSYSVDYFQYASSEFRSFQANDTIALHSTPFILDEVIVKNTTQVLHKKFSKKSKIVSALPISSGQEYYTQIITTQPTELSLTGIRIYLKKYVGNNAKDQGHATFVVRINVYENQDDMLSEKIYSSAPIRVKFTSKELVEVDTSDENITLTSAGLWIGIEMIGVYNQVNQLLKEGNTRIVVSDVEDPDFSLKSYIRTSPVMNYTPINTILKHLPKAQLDKVNLHPAMELLFKH